VVCMEGKNSAYMGLAGTLKKINLLEDLDIGWRMIIDKSLRKTEEERGLDLCGCE